MGTIVDTLTKGEGRMNKRCGFWVLLVMLAILAVFQSVVFAAVGLLVDGTKEGVYENLDLPPGFTVTKSGTKADMGVDTLIASIEEVTTSSANPGVGAASITDLLTLVTTNDTGGSSDVLTLADGTMGQLKIVTLKSHLEMSGLKVTPTNILGTTTDVLLSTTGDSVTFVFDGDAWNILSTSGTRE